MDLYIDTNIYYDDERNERGFYTPPGVHSPVYYEEREDNSLRWLFIIIFLGVCFYYSKPFFFIILFCLSFLYKQRTQL